MGRIIKMRTCTGQRDCHRALPRAPCHRRWSQGMCCKNSLPGALLCMTMMPKPQRPAIFKWRHFAPEVILCAVRWYLRYSLSYRDVQGLLVERGLEIDHTTAWRWVQDYAPELEERTRPHLKPTNKSWRVD